MSSSPPVNLWAFYLLFTKGLHFEYIILSFPKWLLHHCVFFSWNLPKDQIKDDSMFPLFKEHNPASDACIAASPLPSSPFSSLLPFCVPTPQKWTWLTLRWHNHATCKHRLCSFSEFQSEWPALYMVCVFLNVCRESRVRKAYNP